MSREKINLAETIRNYWASLGCVVEARLLSSGDSPVVASDLGPNGLPRYVARDGGRLSPITSEEAARVSNRSYEKFYRKSGG